MKVERVREKDGKLELSVTLEGKECAKEMSKIASYEISKNKYKYTEADGDPIQFLRDRLGADEAAFCFDEGIMRHRVPFALTAAAIDAIGTPVYKCLEHASEKSGFSYHMVCVPVPEFELSDYSPVSIKLPKSEVKSAEIEEELQRMAQASAVAVTNETHDKVIKGDKVEIAMHTTLNGEEVKPLCSDAREYNTGIFAMPDDFDNAIIGMKVGETKSFSFEGPQTELDANGHPIMDTYETTVTLNRILDMKAPELDDAWAKTTMPNINSLDDLRAKIREKLEKQHKDEYSRRAQMLAGNELAKRLDGEISDLIYGVAVKEAREQLTTKLREENISLDDYLKREGIEKDQLNNTLMLQVRSQLTRQFALNAYAKHENLVADEQDIEMFFESVAPGQAKQAMADFRRDGKMFAARCAATRLKAARKLVEEAEIL